MVDTNKRFIRSRAASREAQLRAELEAYKVGYAALAAAARDLANGELETRVQASPGMHEYPIIEQTRNHINHYLDMSDGLVREAAAARVGEAGKGFAHQYR